MTKFKKITNNEVLKKEKSLIKPVLTDIKTADFIQSFFLHRDISVSDYCILQLPVPSQIA